MPPKPNFMYSQYLPLKRNNMQKLSGIRKKIDVVDKKILNLLNARADYALDIAKIKESYGGEYYLPHREKKVITNINTMNKGPLSRENVEAIYQEILNSCRSLQRRLRIAYLGPEATFTHLAAIKNFGRYTDFISANSIADVFSEVEKQRVDYGVVPIENPTEGVINHTLDMFMESAMLICNEINLPEVRIIESSSTARLAKKARFLVIGRTTSKRSGQDKTSIVFSVKDHIGALYDMLVPFKKNKVNLTKIESRPTRKKAWEYVFFIDFLGHIEDKNVKSALKELNRHCAFLKVLGSYPRAE